MEWSNKAVFPLQKALQRIWRNVAFRLGIRNRELLKLRHAVKKCESKDVRVMWDILKSTDTMPAVQSPAKKHKRTVSRFFTWAKNAPRFCHTF